MTRHYETSPFIKTAFVAIALAATSMSSAAHAQDFLATLSTQGLSNELSLDVNPQLIETLQNLERGICQDPTGVDLMIKNLENDIDRLKSEITAAKKASASLRKEVEKQRAVIAAKRKQLDELNTTDGITDAEDLRLQFQLQDELRELRGQIGPLELELQTADAAIQALQSKLDAQAATLKLLKARKAEACKEKK